MTIWHRSLGKRNYFAIHPPSMELSYLEDSEMNDEHMKTLHRSLAKELHTENQVEKARGAIPPARWHNMQLCGVTRKPRESCPL